MEQLQTGVQPKSTDSAPMGGKALAEAIQGVVDRCRKCEEGSQKASQAFQALLSVYNSLVSKKWDAMARQSGAGTAEGHPGSAPSLNTLEIIKELEFKDRIIAECCISRPKIAECRAQSVAAGRSRAFGVFAVETCPGRR